MYACKPVMDICKENGWKYIIRFKEEYDQVSEQAERMKLSLRKYAKMRVLDQEPGPDMRCRQIMQLMPYFYHAADSVADSNVQQELWKIGGQICRCLR